MELKDAIRAHALANAVKFKGKASAGAVFGKVLSEFPDQKNDMNGLQKLVSEILEEINSLSIKQQTDAYKSFENKIRKKEPKRQSLFSFMNIAKGDKVVTAFPPEPSKYPHIGHAKAIIVNYMLAREHGGKFILRFEDTNPSTVKAEFYDQHLKDYEWLGIQPDEVVYVSDYMDEFVTLADKLVAEGDAYVETGTQEEISEARKRGLPTPSRKRTIDENQKLWADFDNLREGEASLRLKIDPKHKNSTMRDPIIMRIIEAEHPRTGKKYRVWPTYDFENSIMDGLNGVTHRLRSKEFEMRNELQRYIQELLKFKPTSIFEFARFNLEGVESSGRVIREKIENKELVGWDDPTLTTIVALRRRGFQPEAVKDFVVSTGITKSEATLTWDDLIMHNKRLLDKQCNRYFFIEDPVKVRIRGTPKLDVKLKLHPEDKERGMREFKTSENFILSEKDVAQIGRDELIRLMGALNFKKKGADFQFVSASMADYKKLGTAIIHWLPAVDDLVKVKVMMPDKKVLEGYGEPLVKKIKVGEEIQFERFGFCRLDDIIDGVYSFWYTSK